MLHVMEIYEDRRSDENIMKLSLRVALANAMTSSYYVKITMKSTHSFKDVHISSYTIRIFTPRFLIRTPAEVFFGSLDTYG
jgi:hypothetical protein